MNKAKLRTTLTPYLFLAVPVIIYMIWVIGPMFYSFYLSLTKWDGFSAPQFIGLANFRRLITDPVFYTSLWNNLEWIAVFMTIPIVMGLFIAMSLNRDIPGSKFFKACFFAPMVLSLVVSGLVWSWLYNPGSGLINTVLRQVGLGDLARGWLSEPEVVMEAVITVAVWRQVGYVMVLYLAGLQSIDRNLIDASHVDGANAVQRFFNVILPQLAPVTVVVIVISIIDSLRAFDLVSVMTRGGPFNSSSVLANYMYIQAFNNYRMGYGAAISVVLFMISAAFIVFYLTRIVREETNG
ncbi:MAG: carbohydrate ABC transporter permease [Spirochaetota bacterium]